MQNKETVQKSRFPYGAILVVLFAFTGCVMPALPTTAIPSVSAP